MSKKINQLQAATDAEAKNDSRMWAQADPVTGLSKYVTGSQAKSAYHTQKLKYKGLGTEGKTLSLSQLAGMNILMIGRSMGFIYEKEDIGDPDSDEFKFDGINITLGADINLNEKFIILYRNF